MKNIFVIDQSILDFDTNKFVTLIALFNSIIVGNIINKEVNMNLLSKRNLNLFYIIINVSIFYIYKH